MFYDNLSNEIEQLIKLKSEGDYWDFKQEWHCNKAELLHDIICMANNLTNRDAYIVIGIEDKTYKVVGAPEANKKNQQNLIDFLKDKKFSGGVRPTVYVKTLSICESDVDIIIVKNTNTTPYYLTEDYFFPKKDGEGKRVTIKAAHIYTRIGDTNTPKGTTADDDKISYLWKKRFGLDLTPLEKVKFLLEYPNDWVPMGTDGKHSTNIERCSGVWYNKNNPEFTISYEIDEGRFVRGSINHVEEDVYWMSKLPGKTHNSYIYNLNINYHSTVMFSTLAVFADGFKFDRVLWKKNTLFENASQVCLQYIYIEQDSLEFLLDNWLENREETLPGTESNSFRTSLNSNYFCGYSSHGYRKYNPYSVVPVFENADEHKVFIEFVKFRKNEFLESIGDYSFSNDKYKDSEYKYPAAYPDYIEYLCKSGKMLVSWLESWRRG